jgi:hypothetical protein
MSSEFKQNQNAILRQLTGCFTHKTQKMKKVTLTLFIALFSMMVFAQTKTEMKPSELPKSITDYIAQNVKAFTIFKAFKVDSKGVITYDVVVTKGSDKRILVFDKDGKFMKKGDQETKETLKSAPDTKPKTTQPATKTEPAKK